MNILIKIVWVTAVSMLISGHAIAAQPKTVQVINLPNETLNVNVVNQPSGNVPVVNADGTALKVDIVSQSNENISMPFQYTQVCFGGGSTGGSSASCVFEDFVGYPEGTNALIVEQTAVRASVFTDRNDTMVSATLSTTYNTNVGSSGVWINIYNRGLQNNSVGYSNTTVRLIHNKQPDESEFLNKLVLYCTSPTFDDFSYTCRMTISGNFIKVEE